MSKLFKVAPKRAQKTNGVYISPEMSVVVTTKNHTTDPFYNGGVEVKEAFMHMYGIDIKKGNYYKGDFIFKALE